MGSRNSEYLVSFLPLYDFRITANGEFPGSKRTKKMALAIAMGQSDGELLFNSICQKKQPPPLAAQEA